MRRRLPESGDIRIRMAFLFLPKTIGLDWRWLEWATWGERYVTPYLESSYWKAEKWLDGETND